MLCKRCMVTMRMGTEYYSPKMIGDKGCRGFYECRKCHNRVYTKESNFSSLKKWFIN